MRAIPLFRRPPRILEPRVAYALWAPTYPPHAHNPLMVAEQAAMEGFLAPLSATSALDVGTGSGRYLPILRRTGAFPVVGLDISLPMLERNRLSSMLLCADAIRLPIATGAFDLIVASLVVGHLRKLDLWVRETARVLRGGGHLLFSDFHPDGVGRGWRRTFRTADGRHFAVRHYARSVRQQIEQLERRGFRIAAIAEPGLGRQSGPEIDAFHRRWGDPPVVLVIHAVKDGPHRSGVV